MLWAARGAGAGAGAGAMVGAGVEAGGAGGVDSGTTAIAGAGGGKSMLFSNVEFRAIVNFATFTSPACSTVAS